MTAEYRQIQPIFNDVRKVIFYIIWTARNMTLNLNLWILQQVPFKVWSLRFGVWRNKWRTLLQLKRLPAVQFEERKDGMQT